VKHSRKSLLPSASIMPIAEMTSSLPTWTLRPATAPGSLGLLNIFFIDYAHLVRKKVTFLKNAGGSFPFIRRE
jgi:hypothetical protein